MTSLVCFPFKEEDVEVFGRNILEAAFHPKVAEVLCIGKERNACYEKMAGLIPRIKEKTGKEICLTIQERLGQKRPGKGDAMNTGLMFFLNETNHERVHFYDSDILTFGRGWITKAEVKADEGFGVVRHYYPRSSTDAMITWHITKSGFAILWPGTELVNVEQPLGGELLLTRKAAEKILADVVRYSDWAIDTAYTWFTFYHKIPICEAYVKEGKIHKLYGGLTDLKVMLIECFSVIQELKDKSLDTLGMKHEIEAPGTVPDAVKDKVAYDIEKTLEILGMKWTDKQMEYLDCFSPEVKEGMLSCRDYPRFAFMDERNWHGVYKTMLDKFEERDEDWRELLFKLWVSRVLHYTLYEALRGYDHAMSYLREVTKIAPMSPPSP
ncbi:hypothetical protein M1N91_00040 [Dehalococcoidia bacterium]|nr:hypothetical protein [Dehalococcoidia bacterium]